MDITYTIKIAIIALIILIVILQHISNWIIRILWKDNLESILGVFFAINLIISGIITSIILDLVIQCKI